VNVVGHNGKFMDNPLLLGALLPNESVQVAGHITHQDFLTPLGAENQVVHDAVYAVFVVLITCVCHVFIIHLINNFVNTSFCFTRPELTSLGLKPLSRGAWGSPLNALLKT